MEQLTGEFAWIFEIQMELKQEPGSMKYMGTGWLEQKVTRSDYKQINQIERKQIIGTLTQHDGTYYVEAGGKEYRILLASVTYFKLLEGSQVTIIVPSDNPDATWAAVEAAL